MTYFKFIKPFSKQITVGGFVGISTYSKKIGDVVGGEIITNKDTGEQEVRILINSFPIQGAETHVYIPFSSPFAKFEPILVETTEPIPDPATINVRPLTPTKKYVFLKDYLATAPKPKGEQGTTLQVIPPRQFKKGEVVEGIERESIWQGANMGTNIHIGNYVFPYSSPIGFIIPVLQEVKEPIPEPIPIKIGEKKQKQTTKPKTLFTTKNIVIAVIVAGAVFGILKWRKII